MPRREHGTKSRVDLLLLDSKETVTVSEADQADLGIIDGGGVAIDKGRIVQAASSELLERKYSASRTISATDEIILPGFVDPHMHLVFQGSREDEFQLRLRGASYLDVLRKGGGIMETVNRTCQTTPEELFSTALKRVDRALCSGTTTLEIKSGYGLRLYDELKILRVIRRLKQASPCRIVPTFLGAHAIPLGESLEGYSNTVIDEMIPAVQRENLAEFCDVFCERGVFDPDSSERILKAGSRAGLRPKVHADQLTESGGTRVANDLRAVSADHMVHSPHREIDRMVRSSVTPVLLPASSHSLLGGDRAPAQELLSMGLPVALGSDFSPSNWIIGPITVAAIAARELRMTSAQIIRAITINAARALERDDQVGSLSRGKSADIVVLKAPSHKWIGYTYGEGVVDKVLISGNEQVVEGRRIN